MKIGQVLLDKEAAIEIPRNNFWSKELKLDIEFVFLSQDELVQKIKEPVSELKAILIEPESLDFVLSQNLALTVEIRNIKHIDSFIFRESGWWAESFLSKSIEHLIKFKKRNINTNLDAFIAGANAFAYAQASALIKIGYKKINLIYTPETKKDLENIQSYFKNKYFGVIFELILNADLTALANNSSILINNYFLASERATLEDLSYFNFLNEDCLIIDMANTQDNPIYESAVSLQKSMICLSEVQGYRDFLLLESVGLSQNRDKYLSLWQNFNNPGINNTKV